MVLDEWFCATGSDLPNRKFLLANNFHSMHIDKSIWTYMIYNS